MITLIRLILSSLLLIAEVFFPDANMIVFIAIVLIVGAVLIDQQYVQKECTLLNRLKQDFIDAAARVRGR